MSPPSRVCVCVPVHNEQDDLPNLLAALAAQVYPGTLGLVATLNNCTDGSVRIVEAAQRRHAARLDIMVDVVRFDPPDAHVGSARERAMRLGAAWLDGAARLDPDGAAVARQVLLTTDADATPPPAWLAANIAAIDAGADLVGGRLVAVTAAPFTGDLARRHALLERYWQAVRALEDRLDPVAEDPAPRHGDHTGGSLAVRRAVYEALGGIPRLPHGEDTAFVRAAVAAGYRLRHPPDVWVGVSAREDGRAAGGMAASMKAARLMAENNVPLLVPSAEQWHARVVWRAAVRRAGGAAAVARAEPDLPPLRDDTPIARALSQLIEPATCA